MDVVHGLQGHLFFFIFYSRDMGEIVQKRTFNVHTIHSLYPQWPNKGEEEKKKNSLPQTIHNPRSVRVRATPSKCP